MEDEYLIAMDVESAIAEDVAQVVGPISTLAEALELPSGSFDAAVLDIQLHDKPSHPFALNLLNAGNGASRALSIWVVAMASGRSRFALPPACGLSVSSSIAGFMPYSERASLEPGSSFRNAAPPNTVTGSV